MLYQVYSEVDKQDYTLSVCYIIYTYSIVFKLCNSLRAILVLGF